MGCVGVVCFLCGVLWGVFGVVWEKVGLGWFCCVSCWFEIVVCGLFGGLVLVGLCEVLFFRICTIVDINRKG